MSGIIGRQGYGFQDHLLLLRVLDVLVERRLAQIAGESAPDREFHIEASADNQSPDWDLLVEEQGRRVLEEVKGGDIPKRERLALWRRIRHTVASQDAVPGERFVIRLSVDRSNPPTLSEHWPHLAAVSREMTGTMRSRGTTRRRNRRRSSRRTRIANALGLAKEALLHLTRRVGKAKGEQAGNAADPVLTLERAREVLASFDYNDRHSRAEVAAQIRSRIEALNLSLPPQAIYEAARGFISARGDDPERPRHTFRASELIQSIQALAVLSRVDLEDAQLWGTLCNLALEPEPGTQAAAGGGLSYRDWRVVQPELANLLDTSQKNHIALVGPGGQGKSTILRRLYEKEKSRGAHCLWLQGENLAGLDLRHLGPALSLGAWYHHHHQQSGRALTIFIDAMESAAPTQDRLQEALNSLVGSNPAQVILSVRESPWREASRSEEAPSHWLELHLRPWSTDLVRRLVRESQRPVPTVDLLELLRTPLLLDLFLRTFPAHEPLPPGELQSRHGLIAAWWRRRILLDGDPKSIARAHVLERLARKEAKGESLHAGTEEALKDLAAEGLLAIERGRYRFRHPLLRDFALQQWVARPGREAAALACLEDIQPSLVRDGALRALLEATVDRGEASGTGLSLEALLEQIMQPASVPLLARAAPHVLGAFEDPQGLVATLTRALQRSSQAASFMGQLLNVASLVNNLSWVRELATLPAEEGWAESSPLVGERFLLHAGQLAETAWSALSEEQQRSEKSRFVNLAERLRIWSEAPRVRAALDVWPGIWMMLMRVIVQHASSPETLHWLQRRAGGVPSVRRHILSHLPALVGAMQQRGSSLDDVALRETYLRAAGLEERGRALLPASGTWENALDSMMVQALVEPNAPSSGPLRLLRARPEVFLPVALGMLVGMARAGARQESAGEAPHVPEPPSLLERLAELLDSAHEILSLMRKLLAGGSASGEDELDSLLEEMKSRLGPPLSSAEALGGLELDIDPPLWRRGPNRELLLKELREIFAAARDKGADALERVWRSVRESASAQGHLLLLQVLIEGDPTAYPERVDQLVALQGIYHCSEAMQTLHDAIQQRYKRSEEQRASRSNLEEEDVHAREIPALLVPFGTTSPETFERWIHARSLLQGLKGAPAARLAEALQAWRAAWDAGFPGPRDLEQDPWPIGSIHHLVEQLGAQSASPWGPWPALEEGEARKVAAWALGVMRVQALGAPGRELAPLAGDDPGQGSRREVWQPAAELLEQILFVQKLPAEDALHDQFVRALRQQAGLESTGPGPRPRVPPDVAHYLFRSLRLDAWPPGSSERCLLRDLLDTVSDPEALRYSLKRIHVLSSEERISLLQRWLTEPEAVLQTEGAEEFVKQVGTEIGREFLRNPDGPIRDWVLQLLRSRPSTGLLASESLFRRWASGIAFAFDRQEEDKVPLVPSLVEPSAQLLAAVWPAIRRIPEAQEDSADAAVRWMFSPVFDSLSPLRPEAREQLVSWWRALESLACQVVGEGSIRQVYALILGLHTWHGPRMLGAGDWERLCQALILRLDQIFMSSMRVPASYEDWPGVLELTCEFFEYVADASGVTEALRELLYSALSRWGEKLPRAVQAAQRVRMSPR